MTRDMRRHKLKHFDMQQLLKPRTFGEMEKKREGLQFLAEACTVTRLEDQSNDMGTTLMEENRTSQPDKVDDVEECTVLLHWT